MARVTGARKMSRKISKLIDRFDDEVLVALMLRAEGIVTDAKENYVPVAPDGGALRSSGHVKEPVRKWRNVSIEMVFGGVSAPYATAIHNHPSDASPPSWEGKTLTFNVPGTGTGYLKKPMDEALKTLADDLADDLALGRMV